MWSILLIAQQSEKPFHISYEEFIIWQAQKELFDSISIQLNEVFPQYNPPRSFPGISPWNGRLSSWLTPVFDRSGTQCGYSSSLNVTLGKMSTLKTHFSQHWHDPSGGTTGNYHSMSCHKREVTHLVEQISRTVVYHTWKTLIRIQWKICTAPKIHPRKGCNTEFWGYYFVNGFQNPKSSWAVRRLIRIIPAVSGPVYKHIATLDSSLMFSVARRIQVSFSPTYQQTSALNPIRWCIVIPGWGSAPQPSAQVLQFTMRGTASTGMGFRRIICPSNCGEL